MDRAQVAAISLSPERRESKVLLLTRMKCNFLPVKPIRTLSVCLFAAAVAFGTAAVSPPVPVDSRLARIKAQIEGVYELVEWNDNGVIQKPPQATGRMYRVSGNHFWIAHKETPSGSIDYFGTGKYEITGNSFAYGYAELSRISRTGSDVRLSRLPELALEDIRLPHMRTFNLKFDDGVVRTEPADKSIHASEFYDGETYIYTDKDSHQVRTYRRISGTSH